MALVFRLALVGFAVAPALGEQMSANPMRGGVQHLEQTQGVDEGERRVSVVSEEAGIEDDGRVAYDEVAALSTALQKQPPPAFEETPSGELMQAGASMTPRRAGTSKMPTTGDVGEAALTSDTVVASMEVTRGESRRTPRASLRLMSASSTFVAGVDEGERRVSVVSEEAGIDNGGRVAYDEVAALSTALQKQPPPAFEETPLGELMQAGAIMTPRRAGTSNMPTTGDVGEATLTSDTIVAAMEVTRGESRRTPRASLRLLSASSTSVAVVDDDSDTPCRHCRPYSTPFLHSLQHTLQQAYQMLAGYVFKRQTGSVLQLSLPSWRGGLCSRSFGAPPVAYEYTCLPSSGSLAFGPDPATALRAVLMEVSVVNVANASEQRAAAPAWHLTTGMAVVFRFGFSSREQLAARRLVLTQKLEQDNLCSYCNKTEVKRMSAAISDEIKLLDGGWRSTEEMQSSIEVVAPLGPARGERTFQCMDTAYVLFGARPYLKPWRPSDVCILQGAVYVLDSPTHRILKLSPGDKHASLYFGGTKGDRLDQLKHPTSLLFHEDAFYITDCYNHRILKLVPGEAEASLFFGGTEGPGFDQLNGSTSLIFQGDAAYIADTYNHRILEVLIGNKMGSLFFGGTKGDGLDQLNNPWYLLFSQDAFYVVDQGNDRILRFAHGAKKADLYFGGRNGSGFDQLNSPTSIAFHDHFFYIADELNHRILKLEPGQKTASLYFGGKQGEGLDQLSHPVSIRTIDDELYVVDQWNRRVLKLMPGEKNASLCFGEMEEDGLDRYDNPTSMLFHEDVLYICDRDNNRILRVVPGRETASLHFGGTRGNGLDQLSSPTGILFHEHALFIVDAGNHRVLKVLSGKGETSLFFGGTKGDGLDQLDTPFSILFHVDAFYIVDQGNNRILKLEPGNKHASLYFGGTEGGDGFNQLNKPTNILFHEDACYVVDYHNHRILKFLPGNKTASLHFGGTLGNGLDQLDKPVSMIVHEDSFYIVEYGNLRVLRLPFGAKNATVFMGQGCDCDTAVLEHPASILWYEGAPYVLDAYRVLARPRDAVVAAESPKMFGELLGECAHAWISDSRNRTVVELNCSMPAPTIIDDQLSHAQLALPSFTLPHTSDDARLVRLRVSATPMVFRDLGARAIVFRAVLLVLVVLVLFAHMWGTLAAHVAAACVAAFGLYFGPTNGMVKIPNIPGESWTAFAAVAASVLLPSAVVPAYVYWESPDQWSRDELVDRTCSTGIRWELHVFTLLCAIISISLWRIPSLVIRSTEITDESTKDDTKSGEPEQPASACPGCLQCLKVPKAHRRFLLPRLVRDRLRHTKLDSVRSMPRPLVFDRSLLLFTWLYGSVFDEYADYNAVIIEQACGFEYADLQGFFLISTTLLQHVGGALFIICYEKGGPHKIWQAAVCLVAAPPMELLGLHKTGEWLHLVRTVFEDMPQLVFQAIFTCMVKMDVLVCVNMFVTAGILLFNLSRLMISRGATAVAASKPESEPLI